MNHRVCLLICGTLFLSAALSIPVEDAEQKDHVIKIFDVAVRESVQEAQNNEVQYKDCWKQCKKSGPCAYCGDKHMCCRHNERHGGCNGGGPAWRHGCQGGYPITYHRHHKHHRHHQHHTHRPNQNCWDKCNKKDGQCAWCGAGGYCCRNSGIFSQKGGCWNTNDNHWHHVCQYNKPAEVVEEIADTEDIKDVANMNSHHLNYMHNSWGKTPSPTAGWGAASRRRRSWHTHTPHRWHHHIQPTPSPTGKVQEPGTDCWNQCNSQAGPCAWCGAKGRCCRNSGLLREEAGCEGFNRGYNHFGHKCSF